MSDKLIVNVFLLFFVFSSTDVIAQGTWEEQISTVKNRLQRETDTSHYIISIERNYLRTLESTQQTEIIIRSVRQQWAGSDCISLAMAIELVRSDVTLQRHMIDTAVAELRRELADKNCQ